MEWWQDMGGEGAKLSVMALIGLGRASRLVVVHSYRWALCNASAVAGVGVFMCVSCDHVSWICIHSVLGVQAYTHL